MHQTQVAGSTSCQTNQHKNTKKIYLGEILPSAEWATYPFEEAAFILRDPNHPTHSPIETYTQCAAKTVHMVKQPLLQFPKPRKLTSPLTTSALLLPHKLKTQKAFPIWFCCCRQGPCSNPVRATQSGSWRLPTPTQWVQQKRRLKLDVYYGFNVVQCMVSRHRRKIPPIFATNEMMSSWMLPHSPPTSSQRIRITKSVWHYSSSNFPHPSPFHLLCFCFFNHSNRYCLSTNNYPPHLILHSQLVKLSVSTEGACIYFCRHNCNYSATNKRPIRPSLYQELGIDCWSAVWMRLCLFVLVYLFSQSWHDPSCVKNGDWLTVVNKTRKVGGFSYRSEFPED